jgi:hypothetical protein
MKSRYGHGTVTLTHQKRKKHCTFGGYKHFGQFLVQGGIHVKKTQKKFYYFKPFWSYIDFDKVL